tara:strand:- start:853 stop:1587 length:735 start_codon:yes stop_codon:yes gene_type:complete
MKIVIAIICWNSEKTLEKVYLKIPKEYRKNAFLSDDNSTDSTLKIAKRLNLKVYTNLRKGGYGSNAKNCFDSAIKEGSDIVVIVHSDDQYDATKIPSYIKPIIEGKADFTTGTRMKGGNAKDIMPIHRYYGNKGLTLVENMVLNTGISDLHSGMIAVRTSFLKKIPYYKNYDDYTFHSDLIFQFALAKAKFAEVPIMSKYEDDSQSTSLVRTVTYGFRTLFIIARYIIHKSGLKSFSNFNIKSI